MKKLFIILVIALIFQSCEKEKDISKSNEKSNEWKVTLVDANVSYAKIASSDNFVYCYGVKQNPDLSETYSLIKSKDLGVSWEKISTMNDPHRYGGWLELSFYNDAVGFISGSPILYQTMDGGNSWDTIPRAQGDYSKIYPHENRIFGYYGSDFKYSEDLGKNWVSINEPKFVYALCFINKDQGFASSDKGFYETIDGGSTWHLKSNPLELFDLMSFLDNRNGIATSKHIACRDCYPERLVNITNDGGLTWQIIKLDSIAKGKLGLSTKVLYKSPDEMYVVGGGGIFLSKDNGISWEQDTIDYAKDISINDIKYIKGKLFAVGGDGLVLTK